MSTLSSGLLLPMRLLLTSTRVLGDGILAGGKPNGRNAVVVSTDEIGANLTHAVGSVLVLPDCGQS